MTGKIPASEVDDSINVLGPTSPAINRGVVQSADRIVDNIKDFVYRALNSDVDSVYALMFFLRNKEILACTEALGAIVDALEYAPFSQGQETELSTESIEEIEDILLDMASAGDTGLKHLTERLEGAVANLSRSARTSTGARLSGVSRDTAKATTQSLCRELSFFLKDILRNAEYFRDTIESYMGADLEAAGKYSQAATAATVMGAHAEDAFRDPNKAVIDAVVALSLVKQALEPKRDIRLPKFDGDVLNLPGERGELLSGTLPFIVQPESESVTFDLDGSTEKSASLTAPQSLSPVDTVTISDFDIVRTSSGLMCTMSAEGFESYVVDQGNPYSHPDNDTSPAFKDVVVPYSVKIQGTWLTDPNDPSTQAAYTIVDVPNDPDDLSQGGLLKTISFDQLNLTTVGQIDYLNGYYAVRIENHTGFYLFGGAYVTYDYYVLGDLMYRHTSDSKFWGVNNEVVPMDGLSLVAHNSIISWNPSLENSGKVITCAGGKNVSAGSAWKTSLASVLAGSSLTSEGTGVVIEEGDSETNSFSVSLSHRGSAVRLHYPHMSTSPSDLFHPGAMAPKFKTKPSINILLGLVRDLRMERFGDDTPYEDISRDGMAEGEYAEDTAINGETVNIGQVDTLSETVVTGGVDAVTTAMLIAIPSEDAVSPGDNLYDKKTGSNSKVVGRLEHGGVVYTKAEPSFARPVTEDGVAIQAPADIVMTRRRVRVESRSNAASSSVAVSGGSGDRLGFSGEGKGISTTVALGATLDLVNPSTDPGYNVKPNDPVLEVFDNGVTRTIGRVEGVTGNRITIVITPGVTFEYPLRHLQIVPLGWLSRKDIGGDLSSAITLLENIDTEKLVELSVVYTESGAAQGQFFGELSSSIDALSLLRNTYLKYEAHVVNTVNKLVDYLKQEKLTYVQELVMTGRFNEISQLTPDKLSSKGDVESMLDAAYSLLGGGAEETVITRGFDPLSDFASRGENENSFIEELATIEE
tara:strand:+ start:94528 stop:97470 length:2943 start_codon:yes stop_codon:yes gene_type:complete